MNFVKHIFKFVEIWLIYASKYVRLTYFHQIMIMGFLVVTYVCNMIIYYELLYVTMLYHFLTSYIKLLHRSASNFEWMFLPSTPTMFVRIITIFHGIMCIFMQFSAIKKIFFSKTTCQKSFIFSLESPDGT